MEQIKQHIYELRCQVDEIRLEHPGCGVEKMYGQLQPDWIGRDRFTALFLSMGYGVRKPGRHPRTTFPSPISYPNLIEGMLVCRIDAVWQSDITYFRVGEKLFYLVFIQDVYSRRILAYKASNHMRAQANIEALHMALRIRNGYRGLTVHHSDRGSQYKDQDYLNLLINNDILVSMGLRGQDNAYAERVNGIIKNEYLRHWSINSLQQLQRKLKKAVDHYNTKRPHRSLPLKLSRFEFEKRVITQSLNTQFYEWIFSDKIPLNQKKYIFEATQLPQQNLVCPVIDC